MPASGTGLAQRAAARLERGEVPGDDDHPAPARARGGRCSSPSMRMPRLSASTEPHHAPEFEQAGPERGEVFAQQRLARALVPFREAQREVGRGDAAAFAQDAAQQQAEDDAPSRRCKAHGRRAASASRPIPHHAGQVRGESGGGAESGIDRL